MAFPSTSPRASCSHPRPQGTSTMTIKPNPNPNPNLNPMFSLHRKTARAKTAVKIQEIEQRAVVDQGARVGRSSSSPRMNSSGKMVFQSLERSSSSPSIFNDGGVDVELCCAELLGERVKGWIKVDREATTNIPVLGRWVTVASITEGDVGTQCIVNVTTK
ncbi:uncharacterized protein LOC112177600 [Rosa chinensis]|uniref:uncharacterized protein LOC112177600 n=1 Tax=Rosa chinensis TaxID=74649 RepID=UPI001AD8FE57|nr:uncharacterized protein LOC112177600 [Rosa chinensis]